MSNPAQRYGRRGNEYAPWREQYAPAVWALLHDACGLEPGSPVADIAAADGNFCRPLLERGYGVYGVEKQAWLREFARQELAEFERFESVRGRPEATGLPERCIEAAVATGHLPWDGIFQAREELRRILQPGGWVFIVRNVPGEDSPELLQSLESLMVEFGTDYRGGAGREVGPADFENFFGHRQFHHRLFANPVTLTWEGLRGRLLASCYAPGPGHPDCPPMLRRLRQIYEAHQSFSEIHLSHETVVTYGRLI